MLKKFSEFQAQETERKVHQSTSNYLKLVLREKS